MQEAPRDVGLLASSGRGSESKFGIWQLFGFFGTSALRAANRDLLLDHVLTIFS